MKSMYEKQYSLLNSITAGEIKSGIYTCTLGGNERIDLQNTDVYIVLFCLKGDCCVIYNEHECRVRTNEMLFVPRFDFFRIESFLHSNLILFCQVSRQQLCGVYPLQQLSAYCRELSYCFSSYPVRYPLDAFVSSLFALIQITDDFSPYVVLKQAELANLLFGYCSKRLLAGMFYPVAVRQVEFREFVLQNYQTISSLSEFSYKAGCSLSVFKRRFKEYFDESPGAWILKQKAQAVKVQLSDHTRSFSEIMQENGFSTCAGFNKFCKAQFGDSPSRIRCTQMKNG